MFRFRLAIVTICLAGFLGGCGGESQPNAPATAQDVNSPDFAKNTADLMKNANTGMDKKAGAPKAK